MSSSSATSQENGHYPKIKLYTNYGCGWCHRVQFVLKELGLAYEQVLVDLDNPRPEWFLKLNPRGLVPVLQYTASPTSPPLTLTESGAIVSFLTDLYPSHLLPTLSPHSPSAPPSADDIEKAHLRYRMVFFVDTYFSKIQPLFFKLVGADDATAKAKLVDDIVALLEKEIEPLLADAQPYFAGSKDATFVEAMTAPLMARMYDFTNDVIFPSALGERMTGPTMPNFARWLALSSSHPSVLATWDKEYFIPRIIERLPRAKAKYGPGN
ncbi:hypothetical protein PV08_08690 [Exophiala spinifera]|uniref:GST N-terminal domain-containing protein n=1 Tax=Exophiala spinifera TaxID=91928 RepID=A0A0D1ZL43_9EURO|nr:uncharacterized protein PV08_08690 [Exophiala spinifera]KIW13502.1 hypothetical protein PV08_08690 [Exophiala spinifera]